jgi:hypothetical protein
MEALAAISSVGTVGALAAVIVLAFKLVASTKEQLAARDLLDAERKQLAIARAELATETAAHAVTSDELRKEKLLRTDVEAQRNQCVREDRENTIKLIEGSGIADAVSLGNRILSAPMPGVRLSKTADGALEKP